MPVPFRRPVPFVVALVALTIAAGTPLGGPLGAQIRAGVPTAAPMTPAALRTRLEAYTADSMRGRSSPARRSTGRRSTTSCVN